MGSGGVCGRTGRDPLRESVAVEEQERQRALAESRLDFVTIFLEHRPQDLEARITEVERDPNILPPAPRTVTHPVSPLV